MAADCTPQHQPAFSRAAPSRCAAHVAGNSELELCRGRWRDAQTGRGSTIFVSGVAGIGKSRLVSELVREAGELHCDRRVFQCQPRGHARPFHALTDRILRDVERDYSGTQSPDPAAYPRLSSRTAPGARPESAHVMSFLIEAEPDLDATHQELMGLPRRSVPDRRRRSGARHRRGVVEGATAAHRLRGHAVGRWADAVAFGARRRCHARSCDAPRGDDPRSGRSALGSRHARHDAQPVDGFPPPRCRSSVQAIWIRSRRPREWPLHRRAQRRRATLHRGAATPAPARAPLRPAEPTAPTGNRSCEAAASSSP